VILRNKIEGNGRFCVGEKTLTPPPPLPYRGGESIARGLKMCIELHLTANKRVIRA